MCHSLVCVLRGLSWILNEAVSAQVGKRLGAMTTARLPASIRECPAPMETLLSKVITTHKHYTGEKLVKGLPLKKLLYYCFTWRCKTGRRRHAIWRHLFCSFSDIMFTHAFKRGQKWVGKRGCGSWRRSCLKMLATS